MSKELSEILHIVELHSDLKKKHKEAGDLEFIIRDKSSDIEIREMAKEEAKKLEEDLVNLEREIELSIMPKDKDDERNVILEVRAGTGGDEAGLFAANLFNMYQKFSINKNWKFEIMNVSETGVGGYKEAHANIIGGGAFGKLKFESGVHRVQRVPVTETNGRIHRSAATVAVLPEAEDVEVNTRKGFKN